MKEEPDDADRKKYDRYYELFNSNAHAGDFYRIKFLNDDVEYAGIPMAGPSVMSGDESLFVFEIVDPEGSKGTFKKLYRMIDYIKKID